MALRTISDDERVTYTLFRREIPTREVERRGETTVVAETTSSMARALKDLLEDEPSVGDVDRSLSLFGSASKGRPISSSQLVWTADVDGAQRSRVAILFEGSKKELLFTLWIEDETGSPSDERTDEILHRIDRVMGFEVSGTSYSEKLSLSAPWRYNILFSIGSSIAFVIFTLGLGWLKLRRIEF